MPSKAYREYISKNSFSKVAVYMPWGQTVFYFDYFDF